MTHPVDIAVVGATTLGGRALVEALLEQEITRGGEVFAVDSAEAAATPLEAGERELDVLDIDAFDFSRVRLAIFCAGPLAAARYVPDALDAGCRVIDTSSRFRDDPDVPLVIPEINPEAIAGLREGGLVALPCASSVQLLLALAPIHRAAGLVRVDVLSCEAVSGAGPQALEELGNQTAALLNFREIEPTALPRQIAFNLLPQVGEIGETGFSRREVKMSRESRRILGDEGLAVNVTALRVPVFYGHSQAVHLATRRPLPAEEARELLRGSPGIAIIDEPGAGNWPTAVTDASGQDAVFVGRLRDDRTRDHGLDLWLVADNVRRGIVANAVGVARIAVGDYL